MRVIDFDDKALWSKEGIAIAMTVINRSAKNMIYTAKVLKEINTGEELLHAMYPGIIESAVETVGFKWDISKNSDDIWSSELAPDGGLVATDETRVLPDISRKAEIIRLLYEQAEYLYTLKKDVCRFYPIVRLEEVFGVDCQIVNVFGRYFHIPLSRWPNGKPHRKARLSNPLHILPNQLEKAVQRCEAEILTGKGGKKNNLATDGDSGSDEPGELPENDGEENARLNVDTDYLKQVLEDFKKDFLDDFEEDIEQNGNAIEIEELDDDSYLGDV